MGDGGLDTASVLNPLYSFLPRCRGLSPYDIFLGRGFYAQELSVAAFPNARMDMFLWFTQPYC